MLHFTCWTSCFKCLCAGALPGHKLNAPCTGHPRLTSAVTDTAAVLLSKLAWAMLAALVMHVCDDSFGHPKGPPSPSSADWFLAVLQKLQLLNHCLLWKSTLMGQRFSLTAGGTFKVTVKPGLVQRATEMGTQHTPIPLPSSSYQFSASLGGISTNE